MSIFQTIKQSVPLLPEVESRVQMKRDGSGHKGCCPFHSDKSPSFSIKGDAATWHCFGCGESGDVISFVAKYDNLTQLAAAKKLALKYGIPIEEGFSDANSPTALLRLIADHFHKQFMDNNTGRTAKRYLVSRNFGHSQANMLKDWQYGYCSAQNLDELADQLQTTPESLLNIGLTNEDGKLLFSNRLVFPICDKMGNVIAFAGRILDETTKPKYINSPETSLFKKGEVLYGLNKALPVIKKLKSVVLVEGYFDVQALHYAGIKAAVAINGTALTAKQCQNFQADTHFGLMLDNDKAGITATIKSIHTLLKAGYSKITIMQPQGGKDAFKTISGNNWAWDSSMVCEESYLPFLQREEQETDAIETILDTIAQSTSLFGREKTIEYISQNSAFSRIALTQELNKRIAATKKRFF